MSRIKHISISLILLLFVLTIAAAAPQAGNPRPLTWEQVLDYWKAESAETLRRNITRERVTQNGVAFALDPAKERELIALKMSPDLINEIKRQNRMATLIIECEPDCSVSINSEPPLKTSEKQLATSVLAGSVNVEVSAPPAYKPQKETLRINPGETIRRAFKLDPVRGVLDVECAPDCVALVTGPNGYRKTTSTTKGHGTFEELADGEYAIQVEAEGFRPASSKVVVRAPNTANVTFKLAVEEWAGKSAVDVVELMTEKVGSPNLVLYAVTSKNDGKMTIKGDPASIGNWTAELVEAAVPNKLRWEMKITGRKWTVTYDGKVARSDGDRRIAGTPLAKELEQSIRHVTNLRLPAVLIRIRNGHDLKKGRVDGLPVLLAISDTDRYTFFLDEDFLPRKILREELTGSRDRVEVEFGQYRQAMPELRLPYAMTLRYPDRPNHQAVFEFDKVDPGLALKDSYFSKP
jgi:Carboxypeptidase regulatory-like domain